MNVLVTGGAGYIGSHTCKALIEAGHRPVVYDNLVRGNRWAIRWGDWVQGDIADRDRVRNAIQSYRINTILHFAAFGYVGESVVNPTMYFENNAVKSFLLLQTALECAVQGVVFSSTCATYGNPTSLPIREDHRQVPVNPYGESKLFVERMLQAFGAAHKLPWIVLRYFNAAGADASGEIGECHDPETHLIPLALEAADDPDRPLYVFGSDFDTPDGTAIRDYIHVTDLADAHVVALDYLACGRESKAFNLGTGKGYSVAEVINQIRVSIGRAPNTVSVPRRAGDPAELVADASLARAELGWVARHSSLSNIVLTAWNWHRSPVMQGRRASVKNLCDRSSLQGS